MGAPRVPDAYTNYIKVIRSFGAPSLPTVTTNAITPGDTFASGGGNVTNDGGAPILAAGVCWSTTTGPTVSLSTKTTDATAVGPFVSNITGLTANTPYYARAYATNMKGTSYGAEVSFTTLSAISTPVITTDPMGSLVGAIAEGYYTVINEGTSPVTAVGLCWGTALDPTITTNVGMVTDPFYTSGGGFTGFSWPLDMTGLTVGTLYHVRAFATNGSGTAYGADVSFTATAATLGQTLSLNFLSGQVISVDGTGTHGIIALGFSPGATADWGCTNSATGATGTAIGTGSSNTDKIITNIAANTCVSAGPATVFAAPLAKSYAPEWYLPSKGEVDLLYLNGGALGLTSPMWSSTEVDATHAWYYDGTVWVSGLKDITTNNVWPIRSF
jgi:hypothetical protein